VLDVKRFYKRPTKKLEVIVAIQRRENVKEIDLNKEYNKLVEKTQKNHQRIHKIRPNSTTNLSLNRSGNYFPKQTTHFQNDTG
jgi:hypothetical protein